MTQNVNDLFKTIYENNKLITHQETDQNVEHNDSYCSVFIKSKKILVKGEYNKPRQFERNASILLLDLRTHKVLG